MARVLVCNEKRWAWENVNSLNHYSCLLWFQADEVEAIKSKYDLSDAVQVSRIYFKCHILYGNQVESPSHFNVSLFGLNRWRESPPLLLCFYLFMAYDWWMTILITTYTTSRHWHHLCMISHLQSKQADEEVVITYLAKEARELGGWLCSNMLFLQKEYAFLFCLISSSVMIDCAQKLHRYEQMRDKICVTK